jgi:hypothetical protein
MPDWIGEAFLWIIIAAALVLIIMNASKFATAVTAVGTQTNTLAKTLSGSGYVLAK